MNDGAFLQQWIKSQMPMLETNEQSNMQKAYASLISKLSTAEGKKPMLGQ